MSSATEEAHVEAEEAERRREEGMRGQKRQNIFLFVCWLVLEVLSEIVGNVKGFLAMDNARRGMFRWCNDKG